LYHLRLIWFKDSEFPISFTLPLKSWDLQPLTYFGIYNKCLNFDLFNIQWENQSKYHLHTRNLKSSIEFSLIKLFIITRWINNSLNAHTVLLKQLLSSSCGSSFWYLNYLEMKFFTVSAHLPSPLSGTDEPRESFESSHRRRFNPPRGDHWPSSLTRQLHTPTHPLSASPYDVREWAADGVNPSLFSQAFREPVLRFMMPRSVPVSWSDRLIGEFSAYFKGSAAVFSGQFFPRSVHSSFLPSFLNETCKLVI